MTTQDTTPGTYRITASVTFTVDVRSPDAEAAEQWLWGLSDPIARMDEGDLEVTSIRDIAIPDLLEATVNARGEEV